MSQQTHLRCSNYRITVASHTTMSLGGFKMDYQFDILCEFLHGTQINCTFRSFINLYSDSCMYLGLHKFFFSVFVVFFGWLVFVSVRVFFPKCSVIFSVYFKCGLLLFCPCGLCFMCVFFFLIIVS